MPNSTPESSRKRSPKLGLIFVSHLLLFLAMGCILFFLVPGFAATFQNRGWDLAASTQFVVQLSRLVVRYWYVALLLAIPYYLLLRVVKRIDSKSPGFATFWLLLIWFFGAFVLMYWAYALMIPFQLADAPAE